MIVIEPIAVSSITSSSIPEPDAGVGEAAYNAGTTYAEGARVILTSTHKLYESLQDSNTGNAPNSSPTWWVEVQPTNKWAPIDHGISTAATGASPMSYTLPAPMADSLALVGIAGATAARVEHSPSGFDETFSLDGTEIDDWRDWWFAPDDLKHSLSVFDIPPHGAGALSLTLTGGGDVSVGEIVPGIRHDIGKLQYGPRGGILSFSRKETDEFGNVVIVPRRFSRTLSGTLLVANTEVERVRRLLERLRDIPAFWVGVVGHDDLTEPLSAYGYLREFEIEFSYPTHSIISFSIEGLAQT